MSRVYVVYGRPASGKTYYSSEIARQSNAIRLSDDELVGKLYGRIPFSERIALQPGVMLYLCSVAVQLLGKGLCVCVDACLFTPELRETTATLLSGYGMCRVYVNTSVELRKANLSKRNELISSGAVSENVVLSWERIRSIDTFFVEPREDEYDICIRDGDTITVNEND